MKPLLATIVCLAIVARTVTAEAQPPPLPSCADPTPFALTPLPPAPGSGGWACFASSWMDRYRLGLARYNQLGFSLKAGGLYGRTLPFKAPGHLAAGGEIRLFNVLDHETDVPPAIHEKNNATGLGETRIFVQLQVFDSKTWKVKLKDFRVRASAMLRATLPTDTAVGRSQRYPLIPFHRVLGPASRNFRFAVLELPGLAASADWKDRLRAQLHWTPLVWGVVDRAKDRFLTHGHLVISGRPSKYLELGGELFGLLSYNDPYGTHPVRVGGFGIVISGLIGRWTAQLHLRMSMKDQLETYGFLTVGAGAAYSFN